MFRKKKNKITDLEKEVKSLFKKAESARLTTHYHKKQMDKALDKNKPKDFEKHSSQFTFYDNQYERIKLKIEELKREISDIEYEQEKTKYQEKAAKFKKEASRLFEAINEALQQADYSNASILIDDLSVFYQKEKVGLDKEVLEPVNYIGPQSMKIRIGHILEEKGEVTRISSTRGPQVAAQKKANVELWSKHLISQIDTCLKMLQGKS